MYGMIHAYRYGWRGSRIRRETIRKFPEYLTDGIAMRLNCKTLSGLLAACIAPGIGAVPLPPAPVLLSQLINYDGNSTGSWTSNGGEYSIGIEFDVGDNPIKSIVFKNFTASCSVSGSMGSCDPIGIAVQGFYSKSLAGPQGNPLSTESRGLSFETAYDSNNAPLGIWASDGTGVILDIDYDIVLLGTGYGVKGSRLDVDSLSDSGAGGIASEEIVAEGITITTLFGDFGHGTSGDVSFVQPQSPYASLHITSKINVITSSGSFSTPKRTLQRLFLDRIDSVPEPATFSLLGAGLIAYGAGKRRKLSPLGKSA